MKWLWCVLWQLLWYDLMLLWREHRDLLDMSCLLLDLIERRNLIDITTINKNRSLINIIIILNHNLLLILILHWAPNIIISVMSFVWIGFVFYKLAFNLIIIKVWKKWFWIISISKSVCFYSRYSWNIVFFLNRWKLRLKLRIHFE